jgi:hypothetical protein
MNNCIRDKVEQGTRRVQTLRKRLRMRQEGRMGIKDLGGRRLLYLRGRTSRKKRWKVPECKTRIKNPGTRRKLRLKMKRTSEEFSRKAFGLEFMKRAIRMSNGLWKMGTGPCGGVGPLRSGK